MASTETKPSDGTAHDAHEEHHVVSAQFMAAILAALICLTTITVGVAFVELGEPWNIVVALAIATVKASLVAAFFMHLRWDKPINSIVLGLSIFLVALFLGFSILDTGQYQASVIPEFSQEGMDKRRHDVGNPGSANMGEEDQGAGGPDVEALLKFARQTFASGKAGYTLPAEWPSKKNEVTDAKVELGRMLFYETRLSKNQQQSCNTCHDLAGFGVDPRGTPTSAGHKDQVGERNSPSVYYAAMHYAQFWDGRARSVEDQATMPITNPIEMAMADDDAVVTVLRSIPGYAEPFAKAFPESGADAITIENVGKALGAFERRLLPKAPFDAWMAGEASAISAEALKGLEVYKEINCNMCHSGLSVGGTMPQKLGLIDPTYGGHPDAGGLFKAPSMRNITKTGPYLHDGSQPSLEQATIDMAKYQLGKDLSDAQVKSLMAFFESLTGEVDPALIAKPELPKSGPDTPAADPN